MIYLMTKLKKKRWKRLRRKKKKMEAYTISGRSGFV